jgi:hypothetical protein
VLHLSFYQAKHCVAVYLRRPLGTLGEGRYIVQNAFFSAMALPAAGHEKDDRTVGSSIYLRGAGNQVVLINSERGNKFRKH